MPSTTSSYSNTEEHAEALGVSAALSLAKGALESLVVTIVGEVSEVSVKPGYKAAYFTVKDEKASLPCVMWNNRYKAAGIDLQVGQLVQLTGRFTLYAAKGRMNFDVFSVKLAGEGDLRLKVANLAKKLEAEGLTAPERKVPVPAFPERIGLVTSPRSAAVHDVLRTLRRRFPVATVLLAGVPVEGAAAAQGIIEGMRAVYREHPEVILVVRGGGSFEDLMPFNDEALARAIAACPIPVVTGIGHEVDTTIADMVSDLRASTPTAAAEAVSPSGEDLQALFDSRASRLASNAGASMERLAAQVERRASRPVFVDPYTLFAADAFALDGYADRLNRALPARIDLARATADAAADRLNRALPLQLNRASEEASALGGRLHRALPVQLGRFSSMLESAQRDLSRTGMRLTDRFDSGLAHSASRLADLSPVNTLARGYSIARNERGGIVSSVGDTAEGGSIEITVSDGFITCTVDDIEERAPFAAPGEETE